MRSLFLVLRSGKTVVQCDKALVLVALVVTFLSLSLSREREEERALSKKRQFLFVVSLFFVLLVLFSLEFYLKSETDSCVAALGTTEATNFGRVTVSVPRLRVEAKSELGRFTSRWGGGGGLFRKIKLARYVEPPELPTLAMHKVFGTFLLEAFSYMRNV